MAAPLKFVSKVKLEPLPKPEFKVIVTKHKIDEQIALAVMLARTCQDLSQEDVAKLVGTHRQHVSRLESGKHSPYVSTLECYSAALGVTPYGLLIIAEAIH